MHHSLYCKKVCKLIFHDFLHFVTLPSKISNRNSDVFKISLMEGGRGGTWSSASANHDDDYVMIAMMMILFKSTTSFYTFYYYPIIPSKNANYSSNSNWYCNYCYYNSNVSWRGDISRLQIAGWMDYRVDDGTGTFGLQNRLNNKKFSSQDQDNNILLHVLSCTCALCSRYWGTSSRKEYKVGIFPSWW